MNNPAPNLDYFGTATVPNILGLRFANECKRRGRVAGDGLQALKELERSGSVDIAALLNRAS